MASYNSFPDELLAHILSFLPTKQAPSTSVIAKKWRTLFAFRHNLDFEGSDILNPVVDEEDNYRGDSINKFSVECVFELDKDHVDGWINNALEHGVSELHLCLTYEMHLYLSSNLFISKTLVKLTLGEELNIQYLPSE
ncbi:hypothetical protein CARUB_v10018830mg [Capsella rubella]|uniref:F-box domain-containing protein n=1 Tax=Capsella rubella TaxID=81985 RepID=R0FMG1_9BRAS|nr:hypothetical protein CARUB_v10018830mg [Capsella rubella]